MSKFVLRKTLILYPEGNWFGSCHSGGFSGFNRFPKAAKSPGHAVPPHVTSLLI
jgi:hypothetical protein